jgi:hypothetical protein
MFKINKKNVVKNFDMLNKKIFESKLKIPQEIEIEFMDTELGAYIPFDEGQEHDLLMLTDDFENKDQFVGVLLHEMIHIWQWQQLKNQYCGHDETFVQFQTKSQQLGFEVSF